MPRIKYGLRDTSKPIEGKISVSFLASKPFEVIILVFLFVSNLYFAFLKWKSLCYEL